MTYSMAQGCFLGGIRGGFMAGDFSFRRKTKQKYPWERWLSKAEYGVVKISKPKDFSVHVKTMKSNLYEAARKRGYRIELRSGDKVIEFRSFSNKR